MEMELIYHSHSLFQHSRHGLSVNQIHISLTFAPSVNQIHISHDICILVLQKKSSSQIQLDTHLSHKKGKYIYSSQLVLGKFIYKETLFNFYQWVW